VVVTVVVTFKDSPNYESKSTYSLVLKVSREINNVTCVATKTIIQEELRAINYFDIKGFINTLSAVSSGNGDIHITNSCATDFEARDDKTYSVEITANRLGAEDRPDEITTKTVTVTVTDLEEAPTDIQINNAFFIDDQVILANDKKSVASKVSVVPLRLNLFSSAPPAIKKSAPPLLAVRLITLSAFLNGSAAYTRIGQITANDVDSDNTKLEYSLSGGDKEYFY
jgi:hypothetical protein